MLGFIYTKQLPEDTSRTELLKLYQLADEYRILSLRSTCLEHLAAAPVSTWPAGDKQLLCTVATTLLADEASDCEYTAHAAGRLCSSIVHGFLDLEMTWRSRELQAVFCSLPQQLVLRIVHHEDLLVRSENTVLIAVLSWLQTRGKAASEAERREVLQAVRLPGLSPWFLAWAAFGVEEVEQLLPKQERMKLLHYVASSANARADLETGRLVPEHWAAEEDRADDMLMDKVHITATVSELAAMVTDCQKTNTEVGRASSVYFNGLVWTAKVCVEPVKGRQVRLSVGLMADLEVAGCRLQLDDCLEVDFFAAAAGVRDGVEDYWKAGGARAARVGECRADLVLYLEPADDVQRELRGSLRDGALEMRYTILS